MDIPNLIYQFLPVDVHLGCVQSGAVINKADMNIHVQVLM